MSRRSRTFLSLLLFASLASLGDVHPALALMRAQSGYAVHPFAKHFACCNGPLGVAFDSSDRLYTADNRNGRLYRFGWKGGVATKALNKVQIPGGIDGLAFGRAGTLYLARYNKQDIVQVNPSNGAIVRRVVAGIRCAGGLAVDPISGDLFISQPPCTRNILRIRRPDTCGRSCKVSVYVSAGKTDGITFAPDGTLYSQTNGCAYRISPTTVSPTTAALIACPHNKMDGIALSPSFLSDRPHIFANGNDGTIVKIDQTVSPPRITTIAVGGSRGDFVTVGPDGCLYATQLRAIEKVTDADGNCSWTPSGVVPQLRITPNQQPATTVDHAISFTATLTNVAHRVGVAITFRVRGAFSSREIVVTDALGMATISVTGRTAGTVVVRATAMVGNTPLQSNPGSASWTP